MKRYLVTAALPYANGPLHLGHLRSTYFPGDIYSRFLRMLGEDVLYICATDEHGTPIIVNSEKKNKTPQEFVDYYYNYDKKMFEKINVNFDSFHRTSSKENIELSQRFFNLMNENGYIYTKEIEQLFCEKCNRPLPDRLVKGSCPYCGEVDQYGDACEVCGRVIKVEQLVNPYCSTCKTPPVKKPSVHYFFKLNEFSDELKKWLIENKNLQEDVKNYVLSWIESGLNEWDITRDLNWGVPVPNEKNLVFYVWFDAPIAYISSTQFLTTEWEKYWKSEDSEIVHFIGKDISYHHYLFWPAMLMSIKDGYNLPHSIPVRGYLNLQGKKFSKSKGWYVSIEEFLEHFSSDYLRYYITALTPHSSTDADFYWKDFMLKINNELVANVGNFLYRTLSMSKKHFPEIIPDSEVDQEMLNKINETSKKVELLVREYKVKEAMDVILKLSSEFNAYLSSNEPWKKEGEEKTKILLTSLYGVHAISVLMNPYLPEITIELRKSLGLEKKPSFDELDKSLLENKIIQLGEIKPLFSKVDPEIIEKMEDKLKGV
jgi:methionyl-tRNA synthetase